MADDSVGQMHLFGEEPSSSKPQSTHDLANSPLRTLASGHERLYLGTSSWNFPGWQGLVYRDKHSEAELSKWGLKAYAEVPYLRTVSLDRTYYRSMTVPQFQHLAEQVGDEFRFVVKAPRDFLRPSFGRNSGGRDASVLKREFFEPLLDGLGEKLGVVLFQFPPGTSADFGGEEAFLSQLKTWLDQCPPEVPKCLEVRDENLLGPRLRSVLEGSGTSLCASIHPTLPTVEKQWLRIPPPSATPLVIRWNLRPSLSYESARSAYAPFHELRSPDVPRRSRLVALIERALAAGRTVFLTINNKAEGCSPLSVKALLEEYSSQKS